MQATSKCSICSNFAESFSLHNILYRWHACAAEQDIHFLSTERDQLTHWERLWPQRLTIISPFFEINTTHCPHCGLHQETPPAVGTCRPRNRSKPLVWNVGISPKISRQRGGNEDHLRRSKIPVPVLMSSISTTITHLEPFHPHRAQPNLPQIATVHVASKQPEIGLDGRRHHHGYARMCQSPGAKWQLVKCCLHECGPVGWTFGEQWFWAKSREVLCHHHRHPSTARLIAIYTLEQLQLYLV